MDEVMGLSCHRKSASKLDILVILTGVFCVVLGNEYFRVKGTLAEFWGL